MIIHVFYAEGVGMRWSGEEGEELITRGTRGKLNEKKIEEETRNLFISGWFVNTLKRNGSTGCKK